MKSILSKDMFYSRSVKAIINGPSRASLDRSSVKHTQWLRSSSMEKSINILITRHSLLNYPQLGERKLNQTEQKNSEYKNTTAPQFERTNRISEKYFIENLTNKIGKVMDTIPSMDGHLWLKLKLDEQIYRKPIDFDLISDEFTEKLKVEKSYIMTENLSKDFYVRLCDIDKGE